MNKNQINNVRGIPLDIVMERFGAERDPQDPKRNWKSHAGRITITDGKFYNHDQETGGGGAIDLAMHLGGFRFKEAVAWLGGNFGRDEAIQQYQSEAVVRATSILDTTPSPKLGIPAPDQGKSKRVRDYLTKTRAIPEAIVDHAFAKGRLWSDKFANAVFSLRDMEGNAIGAELRGTYDKPFHGVRGDKGLFYTGTSASKKAVFVESAIEALSYQAMNPEALVIGTAGSGRDMMAAAARVLEMKGYRIVDGFNADKPGDRLGKNLQDALSKPIERERPTAGKDWNNQLQAKRKSEEMAIHER